jgi:purine catabolism regulator
VQTLAGAVEGWAALLSRRGEVDAVWPESARGAAEQAAVEVARLRMAGPHSSATFPLGDDDVVLHPLAARGRATGYVATGCRRPMSHADRQTVLTASALLALQTEQQHRADAGPRSLRAGAVRLVLAGEVPAARLLLAGSGMPCPPPWVRLLVVELGGPGDEDAVDSLEHALSVAGPSAPGTPGAVWALPRETGVLAVLGEPVDEHALRAWLAQAGPTARAVVSAPVRLDDLGRAETSVSEAARRLRPGTLRVGRAAPPEDVRVDLQPLLDYRRSDLLGALTAYLRARGRWEEAARELGVHRNTLRHRIGTAARVLGQDLDDPDVAARLWLALRDAGLA